MTTQLAEQREKLIQTERVAAWRELARRLAHELRNPLFPLQEVERIGSTKPTKVDVRVLVATHRNLENLVQSGAFRRDLYNRVVVYPLQLPPLRERKEDLPMLVDHFSQQIRLQNGWKGMPFDEDAIVALQSYSWPGNLRELRNIVERLLLVAVDRVRSSDVSMVLPAVRSSAVANSAIERGGPLAQRVQAFERSTVLAELERHGRHIANTARDLGLERSHLYKKCQQLGIDLKHFDAQE